MNSALDTGKWKPIETAPRDGTLILACNADRYHIQEICWASYHPNSKGAECWRTAAICGNKANLVTHWMPRPIGPK